MTVRKRQISLPEELCARLEGKFAKTFASLDDLLVYVMEELSQDQATQMDEKEKKILEQRLRDLGYM